MSKDLTELSKDWREYPTLRNYSCKNVEELANMLIKAHRHLMSDEGMAYGYLYQKQVIVNKRLKEELKKCQQMKSR